MVARGFGQIQNVDFPETFVCSYPNSCEYENRCGCSMRHKKDWLLRHLNVKQAIIQSHKDEAVYMRLPVGCGGMSVEVAHLQRAVNVLSNGLVESVICGLVGCFYRKPARSNVRLARMHSVK